MKSKAGLTLTIGLVTTLISITTSVSMARQSRALFMINVNGVDYNLHRVTMSVPNCDLMQLTAPAQP